MSSHPRRDVEQSTRRRACVKFERADRGHAQLNRPAGDRFTGARGEPAGLCDKFNQDDSRHDWVGRKMTLKKPVVASRSPAALRAHARYELDEFLDETHRWLMWQQVY